MGWVVVARLLYLEQDVSRMEHQEAECAMTTPGLERAIMFVGHMLVLPSRIAGPEQQQKPPCPALQPP